MATVFIQASPKGRLEGDPIESYVVEDNADHSELLIRNRRRLPGRDIIVIRRGCRAFAI